MNLLTSYPFAAIGAAVRTLIGWWFVIAATTILGIWLGFWIGTGDAPGFDQIVLLLSAAAFAWLVVPHALVALLVTALAWFIPPRVDRRDVFWIAAVANCATWLVAVAWFLGQF